MTQQTPMRSPASESRRDFLRQSGAASLTVALSLPALAQAPAAAAPPAAPAARPAPPPRQPQSFVRIDSDGRVTFILPTCEMGQGAHTGQAQILAEELGADWKAISIEMPPRPAPDYRLPSGQMRSVGSFGIRLWHDPLRRAAAQARTVLVQAAAARLNVEPASLDTRDGFVVHAASRRRLPFGELVADAARLPFPPEPVLRPEAQRTLTGKAVPRLDTPSKVRGEALYAVDTRLPGMLYGAVRLAPVYAADVASIDEASVRGMPGVVAVARVPRGAVVIAHSWWQAKVAAEALAIRFTETPHDTLSTGEINRRMKAGLDDTDVPMSVRRGESASAFANAAQVVEAEYAVPLLTHVCMEPIAGTARAGADSAELWLGTQGHDTVRMGLERACGLTNDQLHIHTTYLGGGFGRKTHAEIAIQAVMASRAVQGRPVKVIWQRSDDIQQGQYRQTMMARFRAALDASGQITAMRVRVSGPQMGRQYGNPTPANNIDGFSLSGLVDMRYQLPAFELDHAVVDLPIPLCPWRSIANSFTGYWVETFMNECAAAARQDPLAFRRAHLKDQRRMLAVLDRVAQSSRWSSPPPAGVHRGLAVVECYGSPVAQVVEARMVDGKVRVERVHVAIDCGRAINPGQIRQQMHGCVVEGLGAALRAKVTLKDGRAEQSSFADYPVLRMHEIPEVLTEIVEIGSPLGGVGEPGLPPVAPALVAAIQSATGSFVRSLPLSDHGLA
ncbi:molybdopterin cofactor-binding domain-containing protein [Variovorax sp. DT-64]|uniref:xanthine dehydrogenase family protein molybdopterin-binding subunit n=1 Tax=Variovorax sp. DT-64 TaxID=3396160 RepID=UPI003F1B2AD8